MAQVLELSAEDRAVFVRAARALLTDPRSAPAPASRGSAARGCAAPAARELPTPATGLVGRATELAELARPAGVIPIAAVNCEWPCGIGKTRLALEVTTRQRLGLPMARPLWRGRWPPRLNRGRRIADELGFSFYGQANPIGQLIDFLHEKSLLLLLDNFEHLIAGADSWSNCFSVRRRFKLLVPHVRVELAG